MPLRYTWSNPPGYVPSRSHRLPPGIKAARMVSPPLSKTFHIFLDNWRRRWWWCQWLFWRQALLIRNWCRWLFWCQVLLIRNCRWLFWCQALLIRNCRRWCQWHQIIWNSVGGLLWDWRLFVLCVQTSRWWRCFFFLLGLLLPSRLIADRQQDLGFQPETSMKRTE